jgi:hypothetical protein
MRLHDLRLWQRCVKTQEGLYAVQPLKTKPPRANAPAGTSTGGQCYASAGKELGERGVYVIGRDELPRVLWQLLPAAALGPYVVNHCGCQAPRNANRGRQEDQIGQYV